MEVYGFGPMDAKFSRVQSSTQEMSILNGYITFCSDPGVQGTREPRLPRPGPWSVEECQKLRESILAGNRDYAQMKVHFPDRSLAAIQPHGGRIKEYLNYRA
jgi:hypothetical protein